MERRLFPSTLVHPPAHTWVSQALAANTSLWLQADRALTHMALASVAPVAKELPSTHTLSLPPAAQLLRRCKNRKTVCSEVLKQKDQGGRAGEGGAGSREGSPLNEKCLEYCRRILSRYLTGVPHPPWTERHPQTFAVQLLRGHLQEPQLWAHPVHHRLSQATAWCFPV